MTIAGLEEEKAPSGGSLVYALKERAPRIAMAFAAGQAAFPLIKRARSWHKDRTTYDVTIDGSDEIYNDLHSWVLSQLPSSERRSLEAYSESRDGTKSRRGGGDDPIEIAVGSKRPTKSVPRVQLRYDGNRPQTVRLGSHKIEVSLTDGDQIREAGKTFTWKHPKLTFSMRSPEARDAMHAHMNEILRKRHEEKFVPTLKLGRSWGSWDSRSELPMRTMESVVLPAEQQMRIIQDMEQFLSSEVEYSRRFIPWHRGYLFEGPPGTGKSSIAKAFAHHFGMDLYYLPLGDIETGSNLMELVGTVQPRSLLLIEDIDVYHAATERDDENGITLSDLLNSLDGVNSTHGLITVMTTNVPGVLDSALVRPGRVDLIEHFGLADSEQIKQLFAWFYESHDDCWSIHLDGGIYLAPAEVTGVMQRHMDSPALAAREVKKMRKAHGG